jgi:hypothetical protein
MALIGVGAFGVGLLGLIPEVFGRFLLPLLLVSGGGLLLFRHSLPPRTVKIGLASIVALFVLVGVNRVPDIDRHDGPPQFSFGPSGTLLGRMLSTEVPQLGEGDTLVLAGDSGNIEFRRADPGRARIEVAAQPGRPRLAQVQEDGDRFIVSEVGGNRHAFGSADDLDYVVYLPEGVGIEVRQGAGKVTGVLAGVHGTIRTASGSVDVELRDGGGEGSRDDGPLEIRTDDGAIEIDSHLPADLLLRSDSGVVVDGIDHGRSYTSADDGVEITARSDGGEIHVTTPAEGSAPRASIPTIPPTPTIPPIPTTPSVPSGD